VLTGTALGEFYALACAVVWAAAVILFKKSGEHLAPLPLAFFKNLLGLSLMLLTLLVWHQGSIPSLSTPDMGLLLVSGLLGIAVGDSLYLRALHRVGAAPVAVAQTLYSPFVILLSLAFLGERLGLNQWLGVGLVLVGVLAVSAHGSPGLSRRDLAWGMGEGTAAVFAMAAGIVMAKPVLDRADFLAVVAVRMFAGVVDLFLVLLRGEGLAGLRADLAAVRDWRPIIAASVLGTYLSMMLWLAGYKYAPASVAAVLNEAAGVLIVILAVLFLKERVSLRQSLGIASAFAGVVLVVLG
jgi:drug/metabolite transporter (DMT)-like permease